MQCLQLQNLSVMKHNSMHFAQKAIWRIKISFKVTKKLTRSRLVTTFSPPLISISHRKLAIFTAFSLTCRSWSKRKEFWKGSKRLSVKNNSKRLTMGLPTLPNLTVPNQPLPHECSPSNNNFPAILQLCIPTPVTPLTSEAIPLRRKSKNLYDWLLAWCLLYPLFNAFHPPPPTFHWDDFDCECVCPCVFNCKAISLLMLQST